MKSKISRRGFLKLSGGMAAGAGTMVAGVEAVQAAQGDVGRFTLPYPVKTVAFVRELKHSLERACIMAPLNTIVCGDLFEDRALGDVSVVDVADDLNRYLYACERTHITRALLKHGWKIGNAAAGLGISRKNLWEKMKKLRIREES